jgi:hypothetical protein
MPPNEKGRHKGDPIPNFVLADTSEFKRNNTRFQAVLIARCGLFRWEGEAMNRERLPNRRGAHSFNFVHDGRTYHATATRYPDGRVAEIFLDVGKAGSAVQQHAEATAVLASLALQHGVEVRTLVHAVAGGPLAVALELAVAS